MTPYFGRSLILDTNSLFEIKSFKLNIYLFFLILVEKVQGIIISKKKKKKMLFSISILTKIKCFQIKMQNLLG